jgi:NADH-quinone oxidoreductase subunit K
MSFEAMFPAAVPLSHFLMFSAVLFAIGIYGLLSRRNAIGMLLSIELMLNAVNVNLAAFSRSGLREGAGVGQLLVVFLVTVAVAEAAVGLAIILAIYRIRRSVQADEINLLRG